MKFSLFKPVDMTIGSPVKQIVTFVIPMLLGNLAQQLYNTADSIIVGRFVGDNALAAVGSAGPIVNLMLVLFMGIAVGAGIMVSQYFGARRREDLSRAICCCMTATIVCGIFIAIITPFVTMPLLKALNTPDTIIIWCRNYLYILFFGFLGCAFYNILCGILRGLGDSFSALMYLLVATVINVALDLLFVVKFNLGVSGVAMATVIAQTISAILCFMKLRRMTETFDLKWSYMIPKRKFIRELVRLGIPSGVTQAILSMSIIIVQSLTNSFGEMCIATNVIVMRIDGFVMMPAFSFGQAMTTYAGQNIGAGKMDRVIKGSKSGTLFAMGVSTVLTVLILLFGRHLMALFTTTEALINQSFMMMKILAFGYIAMEFNQCLQGIMRGAGDTMTPMWISMFMTVGLRMPLAYLLTYLTRSPENPRGMFAMVFLSLLISWVLGSVITAFFYKRGKWKKKALIKEQNIAALKEN